MQEKDSILPENKIIEAANKVFLKYGVDGATMQQIADEAEMSRTSLHYYFRNKAHILDKVLETVKGKIIPTMARVIDADLTVLQKIELFINDYIDLILKNPMIPSFVFYDMQRNPGWIIDLLKSENLHIEKFINQMKKEISEGKLNECRIEDLGANLIGMCVFPMLSKPIFLEFAFDKNNGAFYNFMSSRKKEIAKVIENWLKPK